MAMPAAPPDRTGPEGAARSSAPPTGSDPPGPRPREGSRPSVFPPDDARKERPDDRRRSTTHVDPYVSEGTSPPYRRDFTPGFTGLRCRACGTPHDTGPVFVCTRCFGPLEADLRPRRPAPPASTRSTLDARPADLWRFAELLPLDRIPTAGLRVPISPLTPAPRLARTAGPRAPLGQGRLAQPDALLQGPRRRRGCGPRRRVRLHDACLRLHRQPLGIGRGRRDALGLRAVVFVPADLEPAKVAQARALGATVVRVDGPYDDVNRLCLELTGELEGWAVVNVNLRPYYAEGSKTLAFEIAAAARLARAGRGRRAAGVGLALHEARQGLRRARHGRPDRRGGRCRVHRRPGRAAAARSPPPSRTARTWSARWSSRTRSSARWPSATPADGGFALKLAREQWRRHLGRPRRATIAVDPPARRDRGHPHRDRRRRDAGGPPPGDRRRAPSRATTRSSWSSPATASRRWT